VSEREARKKPHAFLASTQENRLEWVASQKEENRIRLVYFLAVAAIQSNRSAPSLGIHRTNVCNETCSLPFFAW
jgi:hypothetical protein